MIIYFAGAKPTTKSNIWEDPREAVGHDIDIMLTFWELKEKKLGKRKSKFLRTMARKRKREMRKKKNAR